MTTDLEVLIGELELAPKGTIALSEAVAKAIGWTEAEDGIWTDQNGGMGLGPEFTEELVWAWDLVPKDVGVTLHRFLGLEGCSWATIHTNYPEGAPRPAGTLARPEWTCSANTEALALCAAALKARMEQQTEMSV